MDGASLGMSRGSLGMNGEKMGRNYGFCKRGLTFFAGGIKVVPVRRRKPAEPRRTNARRAGGKPEATPQGEAEGGRERAARLDRGSALSSARSSRSEREEVFGSRWSVLRKGDFPGAAGLGQGGDCPTRSLLGAGGPSQTWPRGAREASAERLLGVASRPGICRVARRNGGPDRAPVRHAASGTTD